MKGHVHHRDHNPRNNTLDNLVLLHGGCHTRYHAALRRAVRERRAAPSWLKLPDSVSAPIASVRDAWKRPDTPELTARVA